MPNKLLNRQELIDLMAFLGYVTHDKEGRLYADIGRVAERMENKYRENDVMLPSWIVKEIDKERSQE